MAAVLGRDKGMAGVLCDQSNVQFCTRLVQNKENLKTLFPSHSSCVWHNEQVIWSKKAGQKLYWFAVSLLFSCLGFFGFGLGLSLIFWVVFVP